MITQDSEKSFYYYYIRKSVKSESFCEVFFKLYQLWIFLPIRKNFLMTIYKSFIFVYILYIESRNGNDYTITIPQGKT